MTLTFLSGSNERADEMGGQKAGPPLQRDPGNRTQRSPFSGRRSRTRPESHASCMAMHDPPWNAEWHDRGDSCQKCPGTVLLTSYLVAPSSLQFPIPAGREESMCNKTSQTRSELALPYPFGTEGLRKNTVFQTRSGRQMFSTERRSARHFTNYT